MSVSDDFSNFCTELKVPSYKRSNISTRYLAICKRLNKDFWNVDLTSGGKHIGSYGRHTANNRISDIDMLFEMPYSEYSKYDAYYSNGQSAFLQAVKNSISTTYSNSSLKGDGQIVQVSFSDGMEFEVLPVFKNSDDSYTYADSNNGGSWENTNPQPEIDQMKVGNILTNDNLKQLCRMTRAWKSYCAVPIKGILIDTLAYRFLTNWEYREKSYLYYDWMVRDFFKYLKDQTENQVIWFALGSGQKIQNSDDFRYKAKTAYNKSLEAIELYKNELKWSSKQKWIEIYGNRFPD